MKNANLLELESLFLALGDKTRLRLLALMADGPVAVGLLAEQLGESQPKVSRHLAYLRNAGVVSTERDGKYIFYRIEEPADANVNDVLSSVIDTLGHAGSTNRRRRSSTRQRPVREEPTSLASDTYIDPDVSEVEAPEHQGFRSESDELEIFLL